MDNQKSSQKKTRKVGAGDLVKGIRSTRNVNELKRKLAIPSERKRAKLDVPLHRQAAKRIESEVAYAESRKELHKWNEVVFNQRVAEQIHFPLSEEASAKVESAADKAKGFQPTTQLERQTAEVLGNSKYDLRNKNAYCEAELEIIRAMNLREAKRRCAELQNRRALMSYKATKLRHDSRIKSKGYHRRLRRADRRQAIKNAEKLLEVDPDLAHDKLQRLDEERAVERATLKHSGTSKWSRHAKQYVGKDPRLRRLIEDQLRAGRELRSRREEEIDALEELWDSVEGGRKTGQEGGKTMRDELFLGDDKHGSMLQLPTREILRVPDELMDEAAYRFDDAGDQLQFLAEAYEDDDVMEEFHARKRRVEREEEPQTKDCNLYGWGSWTGPGIVDKQKSLLEKPQAPRRKDAGRQSVIVREKVSEGVAKLQPRDVPFPFTNVRDYEISIRQPLGREWNPPLVQASLVQSKVVTKAGRIIRPVDKGEKFKTTHAEGEDDGDSLD